MPIVELHHTDQKVPPYDKSVVLNCSESFRTFFKKVSKYDECGDVLFQCKYGGVDVDFISVLNVLDDLGFKIVDVKYTAETSVRRYIAD